METLDGGYKLSPTVAFRFLTVFFHKFQEPDLSQRGFQYTWQKCAQCQTHNIGLFVLKRLIPWIIGFFIKNCSVLAIVMVSAKSDDNKLKRCVRKTGEAEFGMTVYSTL